MTMTMTRRSSCGLLLACSLAAARPGAAQDAAGPRTYDLTLEAALGLARTRSPLVRAARARIGEAQGRLLGAEVFLPANPTLEVGSGRRFGPAQTSTDLDVGLGQMFELGGQRSARIAAAAAAVDRAVATVDDASRRSMGAVATAFLRARHAGERGRIALEMEGVAAELHGVARRRHEAGDVGLLDVNLAALALARAQVEVRTVETAGRRAIGELRALLDLEPNSVVAVRGELLDRRQRALAQLQERASNRPDLRALDAAIRQTAAEVRLGQARAWPDLGLGLGYAREEDADLLHGGVTLTLPLFNRGEGLQSTARARGRAARIERETRAAAVDVEVQAAFDTYQRLLAATERFERSGLPLVEQSDTLARLAYEAGAMHLGELLAVRRELVEARVTHADLLLNAALAAVELEAAVGALR